MDTDRKKDRESWRTVAEGYFLQWDYTAYYRTEEVCWLVGCVTSQQHTSVSQRLICSDNFTGCLTEIEVARTSSI